MRLRRYARLIKIFAGASASVQLEYRANFLAHVLTATLTSGGALFGLVVLTGADQTIGGWSHREAVVVVGFFTIVQGFIGAVLYPNLNAIGEQVRTGTLDFTLLKPVDAQFLVSARNINLLRLADVVVGLVLIAWAVSGLQAATWSGLLLALGLVFAALAIVYSVWFMLTTTAFWFVKVGNLTELFSGLFRAGQFPVSAFPGWARFLFTFVVPAAFITTVPAEAVLGRIRTTSAVQALVAAALLLVLSRWFWRFAVRSYTSASS